MKTKYSNIEINGIYSQDSQISFGNNFTIYLVSLEDFTYFTFSYVYPLFSHEDAKFIKENVFNYLNK
jgi:hypothetical protein